MRRAVIAVICLIMIVFPMLVDAARFPDVAGDHPYNSPIEALAIEGVVTGNPDGNFYPARPVNRAEFLTMLYRARGLTATSSAGCFSDVKADAWYAKVVCDASVNGYVGGYPDGSFKPEQTVNRVEALKMIFKVFGIATLSANGASEASVQFTDVPASAWFTVYVSSAYRNGMLPIAGYKGNKFYPEWALLRGEAAAYVWSAMNITVDINEEASSSSSSVATRSSSSRSEDNDDNDNEETPEKKITSIDVDFPFSDDGNDAGDLRVYRFPLTAETSTQIDVAAESSVTCRLYRLGEDDLTEEYYLGYTKDHACTIRVTLPKGDFQLEVRTSDPTASYTVFSSAKTGDGNDGFVEAVLLQKNKPKSGQLAVSDIADWYTFSITTKGTHTVQTYGDNLSCLIYALDDVDIFGFAGPVCNEEYEYPTGTYVVRVQRQNGEDKALTYSVQY